MPTAPPTWSCWPSWTGCSRRHGPAAASATSRGTGQGKLLARERVELLLNRDAPFLELQPLAAWGSDFHVGASGVTGIGMVCGAECVIVANDPTVRGGATNPFGLQKTLRAMEIAERNRLPLLQLIESGRRGPVE